MGKPVLFIIVLMLSSMWVSAQLPEVNLEELNEQQLKTKLTEIAKDAVLRFEPRIYEDVQQPPIIEKKTNTDEILGAAGRPYYRVTLPAGAPHKRLGFDYMAQVRIWADNGLPFVVSLGNNAKDFIRTDQPENYNDASLGMKHGQKLAGKIYTVHSTEGKQFVRDIQSFKKWEKDWKRIFEAGYPLFDEVFGISKIGGETYVAFPIRQERKAIRGEKVLITHVAFYFFPETKDGKAEMVLIDKDDKKYPDFVRNFFFLESYKKWHGLTLCVDRDLIKNVRTYFMEKEKKEKHAS